jgi:NitT/TauT family transport system ATP-binding protein
MPSNDKFMKISVRLSSGFTYDDGKQALGEINFDVQEGEFISFLGPSGCGKSTVLRIMSGLLPLKCGFVKKDGKVYNEAGNTHIPSEVVLVFQECQRSLLPWLTVQENIDWAVKRRNGSREERRTIVMEAMHETELSDFRRHMPHELSGGLRQRLALARALAHRPSILFLDEPFNSLDVYSRHDLETLLHQVWDKYKLTIVLVTHEVEEAVFLSQKILILSKSPGVIRESIDIDLKDRSPVSPDFERYRRFVLEVMRRNEDE